MKTEEISTITNTAFVQMKNKDKVRLAGVIKSIGDKETSSGTAKRFKGDIALEYGEVTYLARYAFLPIPLRDAIISAVSKIGKWSSFEFVLSAVKTVGENGAYSWAVTFDVSPRVEMPRVLALLKD